jgi:hypothetical protein
MAQPQVFLRRRSSRPSLHFTSQSLPKTFPMSLSIGPSGLALFKSRVTMNLGERRRGVGASACILSEGGLLELLFVHAAFITRLCSSNQLLLPLFRNFTNISWAMIAPSSNCWHSVTADDPGIGVSSTHLLRNEELPPHRFEHGYCPVWRLHRNQLNLSSMCIPKTYPFGLV